MFVEGPSFRKETRHAFRDASWSDDAARRAACGLNGGAGVRAGDGPDPIFEKPEPVTMAELGHTNCGGRHGLRGQRLCSRPLRGSLTPSPPQCRPEPPEGRCRPVERQPPAFVFSHEPLLSAAGVAQRPPPCATSFFEGNWRSRAIQQYGRKEKTVSSTSSERAAARLGTVELFRRQYERRRETPLRGDGGLQSPIPTGWSCPDDLIRVSCRMRVIGYSRQPVELFGADAAAMLIKDLFPPIPSTATTIPTPRWTSTQDLRYDIYWGNRRGSTFWRRRYARGPSHARRLCSGLPFRDNLLFAVLRQRQWFSCPRRASDRPLHANAEGGCAVGDGTLGSWPIGWLNSQPSFGSRGRRTLIASDRWAVLVPDGKRIKSFGADYRSTARTMELNRWTHTRSLMVLSGAARRGSDVPRIGRVGSQGSECAKPESIADLK